GAGAGGALPPSSEGLWAASGSPPACRDRNPNHQRRAAIDRAWRQDGRARAREESSAGPEPDMALFWIVLRRFPHVWALRDSELSALRDRTRMTRVLPWPSLGSRPAPSNAGTNGRLVEASALPTRTGPSPSNQSLPRRCWATIIR